MAKHMPVFSYVIVRHKQITGKCFIIKVTGKQFVRIGKDSQLVYKFFRKLLFVVIPTPVSLLKSFDVAFRHFRYVSRPFIRQPVGKGF